MRQHNSSVEGLNFPFKWVAHKFFHRLRLNDEQAQQIRTLASEGHVVYVHRTKSLWLHLALTSALRQSGLEVPGLSIGLNRQPLKPWFGGWPIYRGTHRHKKEDLASTIQSELTNAGSLELFLGTPKTLASEDEDLAVQNLWAVVEAQQQTKRPIFLVPIFLALRGRPPQFEQGTADLVFGSRSEPGFLRMLVRLILAGRSAQWQLGTPLPISGLKAELEGRSNEFVARKARFLLKKNLKEIERIFHGPPLKTYDRMQLDTLRDPQLQEYMLQLSEQNGAPKDRLEKKAADYFASFAARFDIDVIRMLDIVLNWLFNRLYDGLSWDKKGIARIREAAAKGPIILVPSHRSHIDYLVLSYVFYHEGLMPPHIAAGDNLSFFPLGSIFRRGGAYFIRRSFKGDPFYVKVITAYLHRLLKEGITQELFIEGTRSRTGKTLPPKTGLLSIMVDALMRKKVKNAVFVPVSISYEKLVEATTYRNELEGAEKSVETTAGLIKSVEVLKKRYGRVYVTFDEPIDFEKLVSEQTNSSQKDFVKELAYRIVYGINRCSVVTPTSLIATALFGAPRRTLAKPLLRLYMKAIVNHIKESSGESARFNENLERNLNEHTDRAIELLVSDNLLTEEHAANTRFFRISEKAALSLDYYKNNIIHHFAPDALLATAFLALGGDKDKPIRKFAIFELVQSLSQIFKLEFTFPVGLSISTIFDERLGIAVQKGILQVEDGNVRLRQRHSALVQLNFTSRLLANFVDAYLVCAQKLPLVCHKASNKKLLVLGLLEQIKAGYLRGTVLCPESASKALIENAIRLFEEKGILSENPNSKEGRWEVDQLALRRVLKTLQKVHYHRFLP